MSSKSTKHSFKAETHKVLNILTHSLYTNREIFLRELLSNASDALDKFRFLQSKGDQMIHPELNSEIRITIDKDANCITISDTGIGMSMQEMQDNLGTIAKSGSEQFLKDMGADKASAPKEKAESDDKAEGDEVTDAFVEDEIIEKADDAVASDASQIIGRFGIGFYSVFMVASKVEVLSVSSLQNAQSDNAKGYKWESTGDSDYTIEPLAEDSELLRGTIIRAHLKADAKEFLEEYRLENIIRSHSNFLPFPIYLNDKLINTTPALWREPKFSIKPEQYDEFYTFLSDDKDKPFDVIHLAVDAPVQFNALMFIPNKTEDHFLEQRDSWGLDLYVRRVLIEKDRQELLPNYLAFVKGVVDTEDLPLNISRETLQENIVLRKISQTIIRQIMSHLERMAKSDKEKYNKFWKMHGKYFKFAFNDYAFRDRVATLMRFVSSTSAEELLSLDDYVARAKSAQKDIWYVSASSKEAARLNPHLERFKRKGIEVLYLLEPVDEIALESMTTYKEFTFKNIEQATSESLNEFTDVEENKPDLPEMTSEDSELFTEMLASMKEILNERVTEVRKSDRLSGSPACMASAEGMSSSMEKLMRSFQKDEGVPKKILEINQDHALVRSLVNIYKDDKTSSFFAEMTNSLFENTVLLDGYLSDPYIMAERALKIMEKAGEWYVDLRNK